MKQAAERIDVRAAVDLVAADLLRRDVVHRAQRPFGRRLGGIGEPAAEAEIAKPRVQGLIRAVIAGDEDVARLDVAMDEPGGVRGIQRAGHLLQDRHRGVRRQVTLAADHPLQIAAGDVAHGEVEHAVDLAGVIDRDDVGMLEAGGEDRLLQEALPELGVRAPIGLEQLERDVSPQGGLNRPVDGAHAAAADHGLDPIAGGGKGGFDIRAPHHGHMVPRTAM